MPLLSNPKMIPSLLLIASLVSTTIADGQVLGCFDSLPSSFTSQGEYSYQSSQHCADACSNYDFFALSSGNMCYCGSSFDSNLSESTSCTVPCVGYPKENCGGKGAYNILAQNGVDISTLTSSNSDAASSSSSSSSSSTASSTSTTDTTATNSQNIGSSSDDSTSTAETSPQQSNSIVLLQTTTSSSSSESTSSATSTDSSTDSTTSTATSETSNTVSSTLDTSTTSSAETDQITSQKPLTSLRTTVIENSSATVTSLVYITQTPSSQPSGTSNKSSSPSSNKGAIIGGVVGGVLGFLVLLVAILFLLRRRIFSKFYDDHEGVAMVADDVAYEEALKSNSDNPFSSEDDKEADKVLLGRRRLSDGSLADAADYGMKILRVANPDDD